MLNNCGKNYPQPFCAKISEQSISLVKTKPLGFAEKKSPHLASLG